MDCDNVGNREFNTFGYELLILSAIKSLRKMVEHIGPGFNEGLYDQITTGLRLTEEALSIIPVRHEDVFKAHLLFLTVKSPLEVLRYDIAKREDRAATVTLLACFEAFNATGNLIDCLHVLSHVDDSTNSAEEFFNRILRGKQQDSE